jgi:ATP-grasp domain, R2K clade family 3
LADHSIDLKNGATPVGSVEFIRHAMEISGLKEPENISYPPGSEQYLKRQVWRSTADKALRMTGKRFVKSSTTKGFTGFVLDSESGSLGLDNHDQLQFHKLSAMVPDTEVWVSEVVNWVSEYRYYVQEDLVIGYARYDQSENDDVPEPDKGEVGRCIKDLGIGHAYALDMGVLSSGDTALVEVNDAWAIGLYGGAMKPLEYVKFLVSRWKSLKP